MTKRARNYLLIGLVAALGAGLIVFFLVSDRLTASYRLNAIVNEYHLDRSIFSAQKLIRTHDDWDLRGDGSLEGIYSLTSAEVERLLKTETLISCKKDIACDIQEQMLDSARNVTLKEETSDMELTLYIDRKSQEAHLRLFLY